MKGQYKYFVSFTYSYGGGKRVFGEDIIDWDKPVDSLQDILDIKDYLRRNHFLPQYELNIVNICRL